MVQKPPTPCRGAGESPGLSGVLGTLPLSKAALPVFMLIAVLSQEARASRVFPLLCVAYVPPCLMLIPINVAISHSLGISFEHIGESYILDEGISDAP